MRELAVISYIIALLSISRVTRIFGYILGIYTAVPLFGLLVLYLPKDKKKRKEIIIRGLLILLLVFNVIVAFLFAISLQPWYGSIEAPVLIAFMFFLLLDLVVLIVFIVKRVRAAKRDA